MSELRSVQLAIDLATRNRDALMLALSSERSRVASANDQLNQLEGYAAETDARWIGGSAGAVSNELIQHHYQFMARLQHAIALQRATIVNAEQQQERVRSQLVSAEVRLSGLNQILAIREKAIALRIKRREQKQTDEFAANRYARLQISNSMGETA
jgi:flagellar FliJ protein